jgi:hypothetical protein
LKIAPWCSTPFTVQTAKDTSAIEASFNWDASLKPTRLRIGYVKSAFDLPVTDPKDEKRTLHATKKFDDAALNVLRGMGVNLIPSICPTSSTMQ